MYQYFNFIDTSNIRAQMGLSHYTSSQKHFPTTPREFVLPTQPFRLLLQLTQHLEIRLCLQSLSPFHGKLPIYPPNLHISSSLRVPSIWWLLSEYLQVPR